MIVGIIISLVWFLAWASPVEAVCPVCTVAVGAGVGISRWLGIDDTVSGVWMGGLVISSAFWLASWLEKKGKAWPHKRFWAVLLMYVMTLPPLYWSGMVGHLGNLLWGIDKLMLGMGVGSGLFVLAVWTDKLLRFTKDGKVYVPYQKVIIPVTLLLAGSLYFYMLTK